MEIRVRFVGTCPGEDPQVSPILCDLRISHGVGDMDCNGLVNNFDIDPFIEAVVDPDQYALDFPDCDVRFADIDGNGLVNNFDIDPFVEQLASGC